jgi:hypothetical protein
MGLIAAGMQLAGAVGSRFLSRAGAKVAARYGVGVAGVGLATAAGTAIANRAGGRQVYDMGPARRHRRGVTGRDIQGAQRVAALVQAFGYKPKIKKRKGRR